VAPDLKTVSAGLTLLYRDPKKLVADPALFERYREAMAAIEGHDGWLAANPFGYTVLDREASLGHYRTPDAGTRGPI